MLNIKIMEKYYFKTDNYEYGNCLERCMLKDSGVMIGSVSCQECENCVKHQKPCEFTFNVDWIMCSKLEQAKGN